MAIAALEQLHSWQVERVADALSTGDRDDRRPGDDAGAGSATRPANGGPHLLGVRLPESIRSDVVARLAAWTASPRCAGRRCASAPHLHVTDADIDRLMTALTTVMMD